LVLRPAAEVDGLLDDAGEVLVAGFIGGDVLDAGPADLGRGGEVLDVGGARGHDAVGGEEHHAGQVGEFLLLVLPGGAVVALEVRMLLQLGIGQAGEHLAVGVDVHALALGLLQQHLQVVQVVAGDDDERALVLRGGDAGRLGMAVGLGVGGVEQRHAGEVDLAEFHDEAQPFLDGVVVAEGLHALLEPGGDLGVGLAEDAGVVGIGRHAAQAEQQRGAQRDDILVAVEQVFGAVGVRAAGGFGRAQDAVAHRREVFGSKLTLVTVMNSASMKSASVLASAGLPSTARARVIIAAVMSSCRLEASGVLPQTPCLGAAGAAGGLLALETEHAHGDSPGGWFLFKEYSGSGFRDSE
jgi:hypothetical protein